MSLPSLRVLLGPAGSGKSAAMLDRFRADSARSLLLVPSREVAARLRRRLSDLDPDAAGENIISFGEAVREIARLSGAPEPIRRARQWLILSDLFEQTLGDDAFFRRMREAPRFIPALAESIRELKLSGIAPGDLECAASELAVSVSGGGDSESWLLQDDSFRRKVTEIAALYGAYQQFLNENRLADEEDIYRLAAEALPGIRDGRWAAKRVQVDGFYRISRLWRDLLAAYARRGAEVVVTLPADTQRDLLFATPLRTLQSLRDEFEVEEQWLRAMPSATTSAILSALSANLFKPVPTEAERGTESTLQNPESALDSVLLLDAPNPYTEVEMVARGILRERRKRNIRWSDAAIIVRSVSDYESLLGGVLTRYGVPHQFRRGRPLTENGAVRALSRLLRVYMGGWQREDVIEFLRSDRLGVGCVGADYARMLARSRGVLQGRAAWEKLLPDLVQRNERAAEALQRMLEAEGLFHMGPAGYDAHASSVRQAVEEFRLDGPDGGPDDCVAIKLALQSVADLAAQARLSEAGSVSFAGFHRRLLALWRAQTCARAEPVDAVSIIEPYDAQQLRPEAVYALGLTERVFPRRIMDDPFFRDDEREALGKWTDLRLEPQRNRADDERLLFYMAVTAPTRRLVLSFPRSSEEADTLPSFYLDEVRDALHAVGCRLPAVVRTLADVAPEWDECATDRDRLLAACAKLGDHSDAPAMGMPALNEVLASRSRPPSPALSADASAKFGAPHRYSVTEIETYNRCPFQHFARYGLGLRAEPDGAGPADRGALHHDTLRRTLRALAGSPFDGAKLRGSLLQQLVDCLNERSVDARPHRRLLMERAVRGALEICAERETRYRDSFGLTPTHFELAFGMEEVEDENGRSRDYDPASSRQPLILSAEDGGVIHLCGAIDRLDLGADGRTAMVMDYKLGSTHEWAQIKEGKSIQIPLYLMAVEQVWGYAGAVGCYESPRDSGRRRFFRKEMVNIRAFQPLAGLEDGRMAKPVASDEFQEALTAAQNSVRAAVSGMRAGRILPTPGEHCRWCDYGDLCRTAPNGTHDGESLQ